MELQCTPVTTEAVLGERREEKCSKHALPVYLNCEAVCLASNTRLMSDKLEVEFDSWDRFFPPVFEAEEGGLLMATPVVTVANLTAIDMTAQFHLSSVKHPHRVIRVSESQSSHCILGPCQNLRKIKCSDLLTTSKIWCSE